MIPLSIFIINSFSSTSSFSLAYNIVISPILTITFLKKYYQMTEEIESLNKSMTMQETEKFIKDLSLKNARHR